MKNHKLKKLSQFLFLIIIVSCGCLSACTSTRTHESTGEYMDSTAITTKVKAALITDADIKSLDIHVRTFKNVVMLSGFVDNRYQKLRAVEIARNVPGVAEVRDNLEIK